MHALFYTNDLSHVINHFIPPLPEIANLSTKIFIPTKVYTEEGGIEYLYHGLSACTGDNPLSKACGLSPCIGGQTVV